MTCDFCGAAVAPRILVCGCGRLAYGKRIATLAAKAEGYEEAGATGLARSAWQEALQYLPPETSQAQQIRERVDGLASTPPKFDVTAAPTIPTKVNASPVSTSKTDPSAKKKGVAGVLGAIGIGLVKFGKLFLAFFWKLKFLLKATKFIPSILSMGVYFWVYASYWGWPFAASIVAMIWIHEMGHVLMFLVFGMGAEAPMFIPFFGAYARSKAAPRDAIEEAWTSLGGPLVGAVGAFGALGLGEWLDNDLVRSAGLWGVVINLANLIPFWILDGLGAARALDLPLWVGVTGLFTATAFYTGMPWLALVCLFALPQVWRNRHPLPGSFDDVAWSRRLPPALVTGALASGLLLTYSALTPTRERILHRTGHANDVAAVDSTFDSTTPDDSATDNDDDR